MPALPKTPAGLAWQNLNLAHLSATVMDIFEQEETRYARRTIEQDEEEASVAGAPQAAEQPPVLWNRHVRARVFPNGIVVDTMVIACHAAGCALLNHAANKEVLGTLLLPDQTMKGNTALPTHSRLSDHHCLIYVLDAGSMPTANQPAHGKTLLVCCQYAVAPERAHAVCRSLMSEVCPHKVIVMSSMRAEQYRGPGDASQEPLLYSLHTNVISEQQQDVAALLTRAAPILPTGNVVAGLPAALLSYCQMRSMFATLLIAVDFKRSLASLTLQPLAAALHVLLGGRDLVSSAQLEQARATLTQHNGAAHGAALHM